MMAQKCPHCGSELPEESRFCLNCMQYTVTPEALALTAADSKTKPRRMRLLPLALLLLFAASAVGIVQLKNADKPAVSNPSDAVIAMTEEAGGTTDGVENTVADSVEEPVSEEAADALTSSSGAASLSSTQAQTPAAGGNNSAASSGGTTAAAKGTTASATQGTTRATTSATEKKTTASPTEEADKIVMTSGILKHYPAGATAASYTIPYSVTKIADNAFSGNRYITSLTFSSRENLDCNYANLFNSLPNLKTIYIYPGTGPDLEGKQYFSGKVVYL